MEKLLQVVQAERKPVRLTVERDVTHGCRH
jgi:hypothetical protein